MFVSGSDVPLILFVASWTHFRGTLFTPAPYPRSQFRLTCWRTGPGNPDAVVRGPSEAPDKRTSRNLHLLCDLRRAASNPNSARFRQWLCRTNTWAPYTNECHHESLHSQRNAADSYRPRRFLSQAHVAWFSWNRTSFTSGLSLASASQQRSTIFHSPLVKPRSSAPSGSGGRSPLMIASITPPGCVIFA